MTVRIGFLFLFILLITGCLEEEEFTADSKYLYVPAWKVWKIENHIKNLETGKVEVTQSRNIETVYIFTDTIVYRSLNSGSSFVMLETNHLSLDSIAYTDDQSGKRESYKVLELFRMKDAIPPVDSVREARDSMFTELNGYFLFLHLENKTLIRGENEEVTEFLLLYN